MATGCRDYSKPSTLSTAISSATCISPRTTPTTHTPARAEDECHGKKKAPDVGAHGHSSAEDAHGKPSASNNDIKVAVHCLGKGALGVVECSPDLYLRDRELVAQARCAGMAKLPAPACSVAGRLDISHLLHPSYFPIHLVAFVGQFLSGIHDQPLGTWKQATTGSHDQLGRRPKTQLKRLHNKNRTVHSHAWRLNRSLADQCPSPAPPRPKSGWQKATRRRCRVFAMILTCN